MMSPEKLIILVGDGMGDLPMAELDGKTPLEAAATPAMDFVASHGRLGRLQTVPDGFPPGSDVANLSLLGYRPEKVYSGRSPLEAASLGVDLAEGEIAFRCNLVTLAGDEDDLTMVDYSGGHIGTDEATVLINHLADKLAGGPITLYPGVSYRHLLVFKGNVENLSTVPPHDYTGQQVSNCWQAYESVPQLMDFMQQARQILAEHPLNQKRHQDGKMPANGVWLWGEGKAPAMPSLAATYGLSGSLISAVDLLKGIGVYAGLDVPDIVGATGYLDTNYQGKVDAALSAIARQDMVLVHVEAPDEAGHQGLLAEKIQAIEDFDQKIVGPMLDGLKNGPSFRLVVCMDHFTPISIRTHSSQPIPFAVYDSAGEGSGQGLVYSEENGEASEILLADGAEFFRFLLDRD